MTTIFNWLLGKVKDYVIHNWKTTIAGILGAVLTHYVSDQATRDAIIAGTLALLGVVSKDGDKSGLASKPAATPAITFVPPAPVGVVDSYGSPAFAGETSHGG